MKDEGLKRFRDGSGLLLPNPGVLSEAELAAHVRAGATRVPLRARKGSLFAGLLCLGALGGALYASYRAGADLPTSRSGDLSHLGMVAFLASDVAWVALLIIENKRWKRLSQDAYLRSVRFHQRILRDDVRYFNGKAYRFIYRGSWEDDFGEWHGYDTFEVPYEAVPAPDHDWDDAPTAPWFSQLNHYEQTRSFAKYGYSLADRLALITKRGPSQVSE